VLPSVAAAALAGLHVAMQALGGEDADFFSELRARGPASQRQRVPCNAYQEREVDDDLADAQQEVRSLRDELSTLSGANKENGDANTAYSGCRMPTTRDTVSVDDCAAGRDARELEILADFIARDEKRLQKAEEGAAEMAQQEAVAETELAALRACWDEVESYWHHIDGVRREARAKIHANACSSLHEADRFNLEAVLAQLRPEKALCHAEVSEAEQELARLAPECTSSKMPYSSGSRTATNSVHIGRVMPSVGQFATGQPLSSWPWDQASSRAVDE